MSILSWLGRVITPQDGRFWTAYYGGDNWAGRSVNDVNSLNLSTWWRGVKLHADVTGALPAKVYKRLDNDDREAAPDHPVNKLFATDPNMDQTPPEFWGAMAAGLMIQGNSYARKRRLNGRGEVVALELLPYDTMPDRRRNRDERLEYRFYDRGKQEWLPREDVLHIRGWTLGKSDLGLSPLAAARQTLSIALATEEATGKTFSQGLRSSGFFSGPRLDPEQRADFKKTFIDPIVGNDAQNHYGILERGFEFKPINIPPKDAEMLLSRRFNVEEIARFIGTPPILLGHNAEGQTAWGTGVESVINMWLTLGYNSFLRYIEASANKWLLSPEDRGRYYVEYNRDALMRMDSAARAEFISKMVQFGQMTPNEGRKTSNRSPMEGGDQLFVNSTLVPLTMAGANSQSAQPAEPEEPQP